MAHTISPFLASPAFVPQWEFLNVFGNQDGLATVMSHDATTYPGSYGGSWVVSMLGDTGLLLKRRGRPGRGCLPTMRARRPVCAYVGME